MRRPQKYTCPHCNTSRVLFRVFAFWNYKTQSWDVDEIDWDHEPYCQDCDETLYDPEVDQTFLTPQEVIENGLMNFDD